MKRNSANLLRLLSIIAVIFIHATSTWEVNFSHTLDYFSNSFLGVILNQVTRFSVPVFIFLSGYGLTKKYGLYSYDSIEKNVDFSIKEFFKRRFSKIGIPFLFFTILFLGLNKKFHFLFTTEFPQNIFLLSSTLFEKLFITGADYHFYFFIIILELYLLFPLLRKIKYQKSIFVVFLIIHVLYTSPTHLLFQVLSIERPKLPSSLFVYWILYFYSGMLFAQHEKTIRQLLYKMKKTVYLIFTISLFLVFYDYLYHSHYFFHTKIVPVDWYNHFARLSITLYFFGFMTFYIVMDDKIDQFLQSKKRLLHTIELGAAISFTVYILHTTVLRMLIFLNSYLDVLSFCITIVLVSFTLVYIIHKFLHIMFIRKILGLP